MIQDDVSRIYFKKSDYDSLDDLFRDVGKQMLILSKNNNTCIFYELQNVNSIFVLEFCPVNFSTVAETLFPTWLDANELTAVQLARVTNKLKDLDSGALKNETIEEKETLEDMLMSKYDDHDDDNNSGGGKA